MEAPTAAEWEEPPEPWREAYRTRLRNWSHRYILMDNNVLKTLGDFENPFKTWDLTQKKKMAADIK